MVPLTRSLRDLPSRSLPSLTSADLLSFVPSPLQSSAVTRASLKYMTFVHCGVHVPTWLTEHDAFVESVARGEGHGRSDGWLSVCTCARAEIGAADLADFAILAVGMYYAGDMLATELGLAEGACHSSANTQAEDLPFRVHFQPRYPLL
jgi:hypothetical protein